MTLNTPKTNDTLFEIEFTPNGKQEVEFVYVWAENELQAHNYLILHHIYGTQHAIRVHSSNFLRWKEEAHQRRYTD